MWPSWAEKRGRWGLSAAARHRGRSWFVRAQTHHPNPTDVSCESGGACS